MLFTTYAYLKGNSIVNDRKENFSSSINYSGSRNWIAAIADVLGVSTTIVYLLIMLEIVMSAVSGGLAWSCNSNMNPVGRFLLSVLWFFFSTTYLMWYIISHGIFKDKCD